MTWKNSFLKILSLLLFPLSLLWDLIYRLRRFLYNYGFINVETFQVPIISVGNLTFGGTGKTPFTIWLSNYLNSKNKKVMILTRGYKGKLEHGSGILHSGKKLGFNPFDYGDEALLLVRRLKNAVVVVGKKRRENLDFYFDKEHPDLVVLDDGHQHLKLKRNLNIVLFDALMPIDRYKVAPRGYMRESFSALKDSDLIIIGRARQVSKEKILKLKEIIEKYSPPQIPFALIDYSPSGLFDPSYQKRFAISEMKGLRVICFAGIASPDSFFNLVESLGANIVDTFIYPDHHFFSAEELQKILDLARREKAYAVTTEKDIVKIRRIIDASELLYLEIQVDFMEGREETLKVIDKVML